MHDSNISTDSVSAAREVVPIDDLQRALASRADIDQAKGILIALYRVGGEEAWQMLSSVSQHWNVKLRLVAEALVAMMSGGSPNHKKAARAAVQLLPPSWIAAGDDALTATDRRLLGDTRDRLAEGRDAAAARRDSVAEDRDSQVGRQELATGAAADRAAARRDRQSAAVDRDLSADDRAAADAAENR